MGSVVFRSQNKSNSFLDLNATSVKAYSFISYIITTFSILNKQLIMNVLFLQKVAVMQKKQQTMAYFVASQQRQFNVCLRQCITRFKQHLEHVFCCSPDGATVEVIRHCRRK